MFFGSPFFLYLLPLTALPVIFHFLLRQKKRKLIFSTLMFFHRIDPRLHSRRRIREWIILMLRMLLIAFLLLALGRPVWRTSNSQLGSDQVILIDNSSSMAELNSNGESRLGQALEGARKLVLRDKTAHTIISLTVPDPSIELARSFSSNQTDLLDKLDQIRASHGRGNPEKPIEQAIQLLKQGPAGGGAIHVFTDLQENDWAALKTLTNQTQPHHCVLIIHRIEPMVRDQANGTIRSIQLPPGRLLPGHTYQVGFTIQNTTPHPLHCSIKITDSNGSSSAPKIQIAPHLTQLITHTIQLHPLQSENINDTNEKFYWIRAQLEGDSFNGDNQAAAVLYCSPRAKILLVGESNSYGLLTKALSPGGKGDLTGLIPLFCKAEEFETQLAQQQPVMVVMDWHTAVQMDINKNSNGLSNYIKQGGNLLIAPASNTVDYHTPNALSGWLHAELKEAVTMEKGISITALEKRARFWQSTSLHRRDGQTLADAFTQEHLRAWKWYPLELTAQFTPLLGGGYDNVMLAERRMGQGVIYISGLGFDRIWSTLPASGLMVILAQQMALSSLTRTLMTPRTVALTAGQTIQIPSLADNLRIVSLAGDNLDWHGPKSRLASIARSGIYLLSDDKSQYALAVQSDSEEGLENYFDQTPMHSLTLNDNWCLIQPLQLNLLGQKDWRAQMGSIDLFVPLLVLAALALIAEGLLANPKISKPLQPLSSPPSFSSETTTKEVI